MKLREVNSSQLRPNSPVTFLEAQRLADRYTYTSYFKEASSPFNEAKQLMKYLMNFQKEIDRRHMATMKREH